MPASTSQRRTKPKVRRNSDVINSVIIDASLADKLTLYWGELSHCATRTPGSVTAIAVFHNVKARRCSSRSLGQSQSGSKV